MTFLLNGLCRAPSAWLGGLVLALSSCETPGQFIYSTNSGAITITGYVGPPWSVVIPGTINDLPVTDIAAKAFLTNQGVTSVTIPASVTNVGILAFDYCTVAFSRQSLIPGGTQSNRFQIDRVPAFLCGVDRKRCLPGRGDFDGAQPDRPEPPVVAGHWRGASDFLVAQ